MNILFCSNDHYLQHLCVTIASLADHHKGISINLVIGFNGDLDLASSMIEKTLDTHDNITFKVCENIKPEIELEDRLYYSVEMYQRYFAPDFFPEADKVLYLDCDMVINGDLTSLWETDLSNHLVAASPIPGADRMDYLCYDKEAPYFNSGVLLINTALWRQENLTSTLVKTTAAYSQYLLEPDQDVINMCVKGRLKLIDQTWNVIRPYFIGSDSIGVSLEDQKKIAKNAKIVHYNSKHKPWAYMDNHPRKQLYWHYLALTPYRNFTAPDKTIMNIVRKNILALIPTAVKEWVKLKLKGPAPTFDSLHTRPEKPLVPVK